MRDLRTQGLRTLVLLAVAGGLSAGCQSPVDYEGSDHGVFFPAFRTSVQLGPSRREQADRPPASGTPYLDVDVAGAHGRSSQQLSGSEFIQFGGTDFAGPTTVTGEWDLIVGSVSARAGWEFDRARIQGFFGLGLMHLEMEMSDPGDRVRDTFTSLGPCFGARAEYDPLSWLSVYGQVATTLGWGSGDMVGMTAVDLGLLGKPTDRIGIFAGYRLWGYRQESSPSAIDLEMSGPVVGLQLDF